MITIAKFYGLIITFLSALLACICIYALWRLDIVNLALLSENKDAISAFQSLTTIVLLLTGAVFSYYKFFRGRTFASRAELSIDVSIHESDDQTLLHALTVTLKNIGTSTIWGAVPSVRITQHAPGHERIVSEIGSENWSFPQEMAGGVIRTPGIDPDEQAYYYVHHLVPRAHRAVVYAATVTDNLHHSWTRYTTVSNRIS